jgi:PAS domain S-box-containing protein
MRETSSHNPPQAASGASEHLVQQYCELSHIGMAITSPATRCIEVNDELCKILGYEHHELIGVKWSDLTHPDDVAGELSLLNQVMAGQSNEYSIEERFIRKTGEVIQVTTSAKCIRGSNGAVEYFVTLLVDVSARKRAEECLSRLYEDLEQRVSERTAELTEANAKLQLEIMDREIAWKAAVTAKEESERRAREAEEAQSILKLILEYIPASITLTGGPPDFRTIANSAYAERLLGKARSAMSDISASQHGGAFGLWMKDGVTRPRPEQTPIYRATHFGEVIQHEEWIVERPDGSRIHELSNVAPICDSKGRIQGAINCCYDVTERIRAEVELARVKDELSAELEAMRRLHEFSTRLLTTTELEPLFHEVLDAVIALQNAEFGLVQLYDPRSHSLRIAVHRGLNQEFFDYFGNVSDFDSACGRALAARQRIIIEDVENDSGFAPHLKIARAAGFRAVQSTPLFSRRGEPLGIVSTHFRLPHRPSEIELRFTDLYAVHAAELIERKQIESAVLEHEKVLHALTARLIDYQEAENRHFARELHDVFSQKLAVLGMTIGTQIGACPEGSDLRMRLLDATEQLGILAKDIHQISRQLHPAILYDLGLRAAVQNECLAFSEKNKIPAAFTPGDIPRHLPADISLCLYRVCQESLRNVGKHAQAPAVRVELSSDPEVIVLVIEDLGRGFDAETIKGKGGLGLISMEERVKLMDGTLTIRSRRNEGTRVEARVPLTGMQP